MLFLQMINSQVIIVTDGLAELFLQKSAEHGTREQRVSRSAHPAGWLICALRLSTLANCLDLVAALFIYDPRPGPATRPLDPQHLYSTLQTFFSSFPYKVKPTFYTYNLTLLSQSERDQCITCNHFIITKVSVFVYSRPFHIPQRWIALI